MVSECSARTRHRRRGSKKNICLHPVSSLWQGCPRIAYTVNRLIGLRLLQSFFTLPETFLQNASGKAKTYVFNYVKIFLSMPRRNLGALIQYIRITNTSIQNHNCPFTDQHLRINSKHPIPINTAPTNASHSQNGIKQSSNTTPIKIRKQASILRNAQFPENKVPPPASQTQ